MKLFKITVGGSIISYLDVHVGQIDIFYKASVGVSNIIGGDWTQIPTDKYKSTLDVCADYTTNFILNYNLVKNAFEDEINLFQKNLLNDDNIIELKNFKITTDIANDYICRVASTVVSNKTTYYTITADIKTKDINSFYTYHSKYNPHVKKCINGVCTW